jgi:hypothetical protein
MEMETGFVSALCLPVPKSCPWPLLIQDGEFIWAVSALLKFADLKSGKSMTPSSKPKYWGGKSDILNRRLVTSIPSYRSPTCPHGLYIIHSQHVLHYLTLNLYHLSICNLSLPSIFSISFLHLSIPPSPFTPTPHCESLLFFSQSLSQHLTLGLLAHLPKLPSFFLSPYPTLLSCHLPLRPIFYLLPASPPSVSFPFTYTSFSYHTAKTQYRKFETNLPRKGTARPQSHFLHSCSVGDLYIPKIGLSNLLQENRWTDPGNI